MHFSADPLVTGTAAAPLQPVSAGPNYVTIGTGAQWEIGSTYTRLSNFTFAQVQSTDVDVLQCTPAACVFTVTYQLLNSTVAAVTEEYMWVAACIGAGQPCSATPGQVLVTSTLSRAVDAMSIVFPAFLFDGERNATVVLDAAANTACCSAVLAALTCAGVH